MTEVAEHESPAVRSAVQRSHQKDSDRFGLYWLPSISDWSARLASLESERAFEHLWPNLVALANSRLDFIRTARLDRKLNGLAETPPDSLATKPIRLAVLGSSTLTHLLPGIRVAALRRGILLTTYEAAYGQYLQELYEGNSALHRFRPNAILFAFDTPHVVASADASLDEERARATYDGILAHFGKCWTLARNAFKCPILQQTLLPVIPPLMGSNEHRLPGSKSRMTARVNEGLRVLAEAEGVELVAIDSWAALDGIDRWYDPALWHRSKQELRPVAGPLYGELVARVLAAHQGRSSKCLVLDLDNTLWGGVIGDDGLENIALGQGTALGEAFVNFQGYVKDLTKRGVILAVCSKNDEANALLPFEQHPEMLLKRSDIAAFVANWDDKATNIRRIAQQLNIGIDSLVFVDDNPFERNLVRRELPMVGIPEVGEDPATFAACLADSGYFEGLSVTDEDRERSGLYRSNIARESLAASTTDLDSYLRALDMKLISKPFDKVGLARIVQLINKSNQFNLTTIRYTDDDVLSVMNEKAAFGLQLRLTDCFGDNGIIGIVIGRKIDDDLLIDTWIMSCRVLGRQVEQATLNLIAQNAQLMGAKRLTGEYRPTAKNGMVKDHYEKLGFELLEAKDSGITRWGLGLEGYSPGETFIQTSEV